MSIALTLAAVGGKVSAALINLIESMLTTGQNYAVVITNWSSATIAPTTTGRYWIVGNICHVVVQSKLGTGAATVGNLTVSLPLAMDITGMIADVTVLDGTVGMLDDGTQQYMGAIRMVDQNTVRVMRIAAATGAISPVSSGTPFGWGAGDELSLAFSYGIQ